jgi:multidrug/hemolysin transport system ATP-binding protein
MSKIIEVSDLKKSYKDVQAVKGISFYVESGTLFAFLGPNGAGKSTTIDIICTLLKQDGGEVRVAGYTLGKEDDKIRQNIGVVFQDGMLDKLLTVRENLNIRGGFYGFDRDTLNERVDFAAQRTGCLDYIDRPYGKLSGGQKRRADIARALINRPKILFLDEPTTGLDPRTRKQVWETVKKLRAETGMTVFLTTHYMEEAAEADYVAVINKGLICAKGTPSELREKYSKDYILLKPRDEKALKDTLNNIGISFEKQSDILKIELNDTLSAIPVIEAAKNSIEMFEVKSGTMDEAFITITGGAL